jgi:hypothetical protein
MGNGDSKKLGTGDGYPSTGTGNGYPNTGNGSVISEQNFWMPMRRALADKGWKILQIPGYPLAAEKRGWAVGMIDAAVKDATAAFFEFDNRIEKSNIAKSRLLVAVFFHASQDDIDTITSLAKGDRMNAQAVAGVIHLASSKFHPPKPASWGLMSGWHNKPDFDKDAGKDIQGALDIITASR